MPSLSLGVLIRFHNSMETLPEVFKSLSQQTRRPDLILGMNNAASDGSAEFFKSEGGAVVDWNEPYQHGKVLNAGMDAMSTDLVMALSSHTVLEQPDVLERLASYFEDPKVACASPIWTSDDYYSSRVDWEELQTKGIKMGSIYSNSCGMLRRSSWMETPFEERFDYGMEDYIFAIERLKRGEVSVREPFEFRYLRPGRLRIYEFSSYAFSIADHYGLKPVWLGWKLSVLGWVKSGLRLLAPVGDRQSARDDFSNHQQRLKAWWTWKRTNPYDLPHQPYQPKSRSTLN